MLPPHSLSSLLFASPSFAAYRLDGDRVVCPADRAAAISSLLAHLPTCDGTWGAPSEASAPPPDAAPLSSSEDSDLLPAVSLLERAAARAEESASCGGAAAPPAPAPRWLFRFLRDVYSDALLEYEAGLRDRASPPGGGGMEVCEEEEGGVATGKIGRAHV